MEVVFYPSLFLHNLLSRTDDRSRGFLPYSCGPSFGSFSCQSSVVWCTFSHPRRVNISTNRAVPRILSPQVSSSSIQCKTTWSSESGFVYHLYPAKFLIRALDSQIHLKEKLTYQGLLSK
jgi:hypothetical protein